LAEKIRISGGGRCNFTNLYAKPENYLSGNPHFCRSALARYTPSISSHGLTSKASVITKKNSGNCFVTKDRQLLLRC